MKPIKNRTVVNRSRREEIDNSISKRGGNELKEQKKGKGMKQYPKNPGYHGTDNELDLNPEE
jgi:hypothetical protein